VTDDAEIQAAVTNFTDYIKSETLAETLVLEPLAGIEPVELKWGTRKLQLYVEVARA
jgi:hypothetical protein